MNEGRWELAAGWVENDANMLSGESFARQLLYSQQFYQKEFGKLARVYWLPDSFGFAASIPQIAKLAGIRFFATHKLFWNDTNTFPYALFNWVGIDGTSLPSIYFGQGRDGYNSSFAIEEVIDQWTNWADKDIDLPMLYAFGYGDGGGGPTEDMFLRAEALDKMPILPRVQLTGPASSDKSYLEGNYSKLLSGEVGKNTWRGELYVETHRGVQTSHSRMKYLNRRAECSLREAEIWSTILWSTKRSDNTSYQKELSELWKILLKHQFHDVLPGSSINEVYTVAYTELERVIAEADKIANLSMNELAGLSARSVQPAGKVVLFNSLPWRRTTEYAVLPVAVQGSQKVDNGYLARVSLPSVGFANMAKAVSTNASASPLAVRESENLISVENQFFKIELEKRDGSVRSLFDKEARRELLKAKSSHFVFYENVPGWADAWDIEKGYKITRFDSLPLERCEVLEKGPLRVRIKTSRRFRHSTVEQELFVYAESRRIDFKTTTDLHDRELLLKVWFHFDLNTDDATYEIPFGNVKRKTTSNTSWERAKFEVPMLKWADLSESDYGVALLNDGRYGVAAEDTSFGLSVAKTPMYPDFAADSETNSFTYSVYPHKGGWERAEVPQRAYELNNPIRIVAGDIQGKRPLATERYFADEKSFVSFDSNSLMLETLKVSEDQTGIILRLYEMHNRRGTANLLAWTSVASATGTDLLESPIDSQEILSSKERLVIPYRNYQITTVKAPLT